MQEEDRTSAVARLAGRVGGRNPFGDRRRPVPERPPARWRTEAGQTIVIFALALPVLLGACAIVIDVGNLYVQRLTLQTAADAAALAAAQDLRTAACAGGSCAAGTTGAYASGNGGTSATVGAGAEAPSLPACGGENCYTWPYKGDPGRVEVRLQRSVPTTFARIFGVLQVNVSARAVASVSAGTAPPYSFAALNSSMDKHTLLLKTGGNLTVQGSIYTNSQHPHDGFDIFGDGGTISAPAIITHGGWETHDLSTVAVGGVNCALGSTGGKTQVVFPVGHPPPPLGSQPPGCPDVGQPVLQDPFAGQVVAPIPGAAACATTTASTDAVAYSPKQELKADIGDQGTTLTTKTGSTPISEGDTIQIESERMYVSLVTGNVVTVTRGYDNTTAVAHAAGKNGAILQVTVTTTVGGTAAAPSACRVSTGARTLQPGTYYGGIDIGSSGGRCTPGSTGNAHVTLAPGTYIMAGGGLRVCGSSALTAPSVLIYNTSDAAQPSGNGAVDRVVLNTSGSVSLGPQAAGPYRGLTIFQDPTQAVSDRQCNNRSSDEWDIALLSMDDSGPGGALGSVSGTIYAAHEHALFGDSVSGTANLAIYTGCIRIEGGTSTFAFESSGLFGLGSALTE